jgi:hypothetical protein
MRKLIYLAIVIILVIFFASNSYKKNLVEEIPISVEVSSGDFEINLDDGTLNYGAILAGMISTRNISITNPHDEKRTVVLEVDELEDWISLSESAFILEGNAEKFVFVSIEIPFEAEIGEYNSVLKIYLH